MSPGKVKIGGKQQSQPWAGAPIAQWPGAGLDLQETRPTHCGQAWVGCGYQAPSFPRAPTSPSQTSPRTPTGLENNSVPSPSVLLFSSAEKDAILECEFCGMKKLPPATIIHSPSLPLHSCHSSAVSSQDPQAHTLPHSPHTLCATQISQSASGRIIISPLCPGPF